MCLAVVNVFNQELLISQPAVIEKLLRRHDEVEQIASKNEPLIFIKDTVARDNQPSPDLLLSAREYFPSHAVPISAAAPNKFTRASGSFIADGIPERFHHYHLRLSGPPPIMAILSSPMSPTMP